MVGAGGKNPPDASDGSSEPSSKEENPMDLVIQPEHTNEGHEEPSNPKKARMNIGLIGVGRKPPRQPTPTMTTSTRGPYIGPPWMTWYPVAPNLPLMAPTNRKSFPYPIYSARTHPDAPVWEFQKAI